MRLFPGILTVGFALATVSGSLAATPAAAPAAAVPVSAPTAASVPDTAHAAPVTSPTAAPVPDTAHAAPAATPAAAPAVPQSPAATAPATPAAEVPPAAAEAAAAPAPVPTAASEPIRDTDSTVAAPSPAKGILSLRNPVLSSLALSGTVQLKAFYHDYASDRDADKRLSLQLRRFKLGLEGDISPQVGFRGEFLLDGADKSFGTEDAFLWWKPSERVGFKGGKLKRPFSQEALQSSRSLYTIERGELYHNFLADTTGYAYYDLGLIAYGGFTEDGAIVGYEFGVFNGKQSKNGYSNQQAEKTDAGFIAKDVVARVTVEPIRNLKLEGAVSTKAAEDRSDRNTFVYAVNTAYELGVAYEIGRLRLLGEASMGDNHKGADTLIVEGSSRFFAFYAMGVWHEAYSGGRASELVIKMEGLDPDFGWKTGQGRPNDGKFRYTGGCTYFFTPAISLLANYSLLQPITKVPDQDRMIHSLDLMWRLSF